MIFLIWYFTLICDFVTFFIFLFIYYKGINVIGIRGIQLCCWTFCKPFFRIFVTIPLTKHAVQNWSRQRILATNVSVPVLCPVSASQNISTLTNYCVGCGICSQACPTQAIKMKLQTLDYIIHETDTNDHFVLGCQKQNKKSSAYLISFVLAVFLMKLFYICC